MKMRLALLLSLLAVPIAVLGIFGMLRSGLETLASGVAVVIASLVLARAAGGKYFLNGLLCGGAMGLLLGLVQAAFLPQYLQHNPQAAETFKALPPQITPLMAVLAAAPINGVITGLVTGVLTMVGSHFMRDRPRPASGS